MANEKHLDIHKPKDSEIPAENKDADARLTKSSPEKQHVSWIKNPFWQWIIGTALAVVGIIISLVLSVKPPVVDAEELAKQLARHLPYQQSLSGKDEEIRALKGTIERLQQDPANKLKQKALAALTKDDKAGATELLEQAARARTEKAEKLDKQAAQDWIDVGNIAYLYDTQKAWAAYEKASRLDPANPEGWNRLGHILSRVGRLDEAQETFEKVLELAVADKSWEGIAYIDLGNIYRIRGEITQAEEYHQKALKIFEALDRKEGLANVYTNLGTIYQTSGELDRAEEYYRKGLEIDEALGDKEGLAATYGNLGSIYGIRGELDRAEEYYRKGLEIDEALGDKEGLAATYGNLGIIYQIRGDLKRAEEYLRQSLEIEEALDNKEGLANAYVNLGNIYQARGDLDRACDYWRKSLKLYTEIGAKIFIRRMGASINDDCKEDR